MSSIDIPVWRRYVLSIVEAAAYYHIGVRKLRNIVDEHPNAEFVIMNGNRVLIKKDKFEEFLDSATVI
ncbi:MAG: transposase [Lachnospiraceae bacterium]|nr:transposase [Lachnospiraceae bacterium]